MGLVRAVLTVETRSRSEFVNITSQVARAVRDAGVSEGLCHVYVPHTTAGVTINEQADPAVVHDLIAVLDRLVPWQDPVYRHGEGNSAAHVKAMLAGSSASVPVRAGELQLGSWQGIFFCEFDGPRRRQVQVDVASFPLPQNKGYLNESF